MPEPGPGAEGGGVWGSMQQQEKASGFAIQLPSNLLSSKAASLRGRPVFPCLLCVPTTWCANDGTIGSTTSIPVIESTATSRFSGILPLKHGRFSCARENGHGVQTPAEHLGHVTAVGGRMPTVGEDDLPLHEMSTNSKRTTCSPLHMVCEVHHTKSGYEQLKSRNSPCRPTRS